MSSSAINLNWNPARASGGGRIAGYRIERCAGPGCRDFREIATPAAPPFADSGLSASTTYAYRIRAYDAAGNHGDYTSVALASTPGAPATLPDLVIGKLEAPSTGAVGGEIKVSAAAVNKGASATGPYRLAFYFSNDQSATIFSGTYCEMAPLAPGATWPCSGTVAAPASLAAGNYWLVAFADDLGHVAERDENNNTGAVRVTLTGGVPASPALAPTVVPPAIPVGLVASAASASSIRVEWKSGAATAPAGYKIERCTGSGCTAFSQIATSSAPTHVDPALAPGTLYAYRIRAYDSAGNSSNYSNTASAMVPPTAASVMGGERASQ